MAFQRRLVATNTLISMAEGSCTIGCPPGDYPPIIVEVNASGRIIDIVDGFHRATGLEPGEQVEIVACRAETDEEDDLICTAANPGSEQDAAISRIYALAGRARRRTGVAAA